MMLSSCSCKFNKFLLWSCVVTLFQSSKLTQSIEGFNKVYIPVRRASSLNVTLMTILLSSWHYTNSIWLRAR